MQGRAPVDPRKPNLAATNHKFCEIAVGACMVYRAHASRADGSSKATADYRFIAIDTDMDLAMTVNHP